MEEWMLRWFSGVVLSMCALATTVRVNWNLYRVGWFKNRVEMWLFLDWAIREISVVWLVYLPFQCCFSKVLKSSALQQPVLCLICTDWFAGTLTAKKHHKRRKVTEDHRRVKKRKVKAQSDSRQVLTTEKFDVCLLGFSIAYRMATYRASWHGEDVGNILVLLTFLRLRFLIFNLVSKYQVPK